MSKIIHSDKEKDIALHLRIEGKSYKEIGTILNISKSLARYWCDPVAREKDKSHSRKYNKQWYLDNIDKKSEYARKRRIEMPELVKEQHKRYKLKNKQKTLELTKIRYNNDYIFKIVGLQRSRIRRLLKINKKTKDIHTLEYLGCTALTLKKHIESQFTGDMSWENHGKYGWHIDHIQPLRVFDLSDPEQITIAFWYTNLQPLWWRDNLAKNGGFGFKKTK